FHAAFIIDPDAFDPDDVADLRDVLCSLNPEIGQLGNVNEPVFAREHFHKRAKFFGGDDAALISLPDLDLTSHPADDFFGALHRFATSSVNVHRTVVLDVNLGAGFSHNALDG